MKSVIGPLIGGFLSAGTGMLLFWLQRRRLAQDDFIAVVAGQRAKLDTVSRQQHQHFNPNEDAFFMESVEVMTVAVHKLKRFVTKHRWLRLIGVLKEYQSHKEKYTGLTRAAKDEQTGNSFVQRIHAFLDRFEDCVSE